MSVGNIQNTLFDKAIADLKDLDKGLYDRLLTFIAEITNNGVLTANAAQLAELEAKIKNWTVELGYAKIIDDYLAGLDEVNEINKEYYGGNNRVRSVIENEIINSDLNNEYRKQVVEQLRGAGAYEEIVKKVADVLRLNALRGLTFEQTANELRNLVTPTERTGISEAHFNQVAKDAIMQYDGLIQEELKQKFKPTSGRYIGSLIEDSRPFCDHMKDKFANRPISITELQIALDTFCPNGQPSQTVFNYETVNGKEKKGKKGDGMIAGTNIQNFPSLRGGYNCRHEWKWIF